MSKTDKTRPWRVQMNDIRAMRAVHMCDDLHRLHARFPCDLPDDPWSFTDTGCRWEPAHEPMLNRKLFSESRYRQSARRSWYSAERAARRNTLRSLTRDAMYGGEVDESVIDNRVACRHGMYSGGWWD
ncbi:Uncharacterised protein [Mycobacteroides abscessus subsp. abscessus]|uniref:Bacteriophage protein n=2 Tax=Mycobacteroides abscessus TaxID=36809 RepID=A0AB33T7B7_9MYCO|nr:hypothetical protein [Mycobacteroides abscessus]MBN7532246.1 hypothetical protein [Mycobacteroides abscessus subsp. abscessus]MDO3085997.1 hypothetical protein [Mycobacteroides abscessus subsp. abscessus]MDO3106050.1 hypothetical protein [Mycobacteroides abscessus subsp. abscessus]QSM41623.1 hypothetical protein IN842_14830 [Mycobacteroides abscessus subsp. abscessus]CPT60347.1 Uncharacterised protein [Mycobacteroides abscessus]